MFPQIRDVGFIGRLPKIRGTFNRVVGNYIGLYRLSGVAQNQGYLYRGCKGLCRTT